MGGNLTASTSYDTFGNATNTDFSNRYQFTGREYDNFTVLHYYRARFYDGNLGRFISEDPIGFAGGDANLYGYVGNKPLNFYDPFGLDEYAMIDRLQHYQNQNQNQNSYGSIEFDPYSSVAPKSNQCMCELENPEISNMRNIFNQEVNNMTNDNQRINNGVLNNLTSSGQHVYNFSATGYFFPAKPVLGCGQQAEELNRRLREKLGDKWQLEVKDGFYYGFYHQFSVGYSSNPNDPIIIFDSWDNNFETRRRK